MKQESICSLCLVQQIRIGWKCPMKRLVHLTTLMPSRSFPASKQAAGASTNGCLSSVSLDPRQRHSESSTRTAAKQTGCAAAFEEEASGKDT